MRNNRFSLVLCFNGEPMYYTPHNSSKKVYSQRDFDCSISDDKYYGQNGFINSQEIIEMGEDLKSVTQLIMREKTIEELYKAWSKVSHLEDSQERANYLDRRISRMTNDGDYYSYKLIDREYKVKGGKTITKTIFEKSFDCRYYSFDNEKFIPPIKDIWNDFDVLFQRSKNRKYEHSYSNFVNVYNDLYENISFTRELYNKYRRSKGEYRTQIKNQLKSETQVINEVYFKGLRSILVDAMSKDSYTSVFLN